MDKDDFITLSLFAGGICTFIAVIIGACLWLDSLTCGSRWTDFETRWAVIAGCQVKVNGKWYPEDRVRATDD